MKRVACAAAIVLGLGLAAADARPRAFHQGFAHRPHGFVGRPRVFVGGSVFFDPFFFPYYYPYYDPYYAPYPVYGYPPPPEEPGWGAPPPEEPPAGSESAPSEDPLRESYGLIQLRGVPDGAAVELDGRFWLTAEQLEHRWLAVPRGEHTLVVRPPGAEPVERRIEVAAGKNQVLRFGPFPRARS